MQNKNQRIAGIILAIYIMAPFLIGCGLSTKESQNSGQSNTVAPQNILAQASSKPTGNNPGMNSNAQSKTIGASPNASPGQNATTNVTTASPIVNTKQNSFDLQRASKITADLSGMKEIRGVHTVINGNTALVGYNLANTSANSSTIKQNVVNKVKQIDTSIKNVAASNSPDIAPKLIQLSLDIKNNKSAGELNTRFNQIMHNITSSTQ